MSVSCSILGSIFLSSKEYALQSNFSASLSAFSKSNLLLSIVTSALSARAQTVAFAAPPAPNITISFPSGLTLFDFNAREMPSMSVLNPIALLFLNITVFTAPIFFAFGSILPANFTKSSLNGAVMFNPLMPISFAVLRASSAFCAKSLV